MRLRSLGRSGLQISEIGFGGWGIGSELYGYINERDALATLERAFERGVTYYDTAPHYGDGRSETLIGQAFARKRHKVVIASKWGSLGHYKGDDFSPAFLQRSLEGSLRRLNTDYVDILQIQCPPITVLMQDDVRAMLDRLGTTGKVRCHALACRAPSDGIAAIELGALGVVQCNFNLVDQRAVECGLVTLCGNTRTGLVARTPLCFGFLTDRYGEEAHFPESDHRARWPVEQRAAWSAAPHRFADIRPDRYTAAQYALAFCLSFAGVTCVIPGMMSPAEVDENAMAGELAPMSDKDRDRAQERYRQHDFFVRRPQPMELSR